MPSQLVDHSIARGDLIIAGVVGQSAVIDELVRAGKIDVADLAGQWEAYRQIVVDQPFPNVPRALVIVGLRPPRRRVRYSMICPSRSASRPGTGSPTCRCAAARPMSTSRAGSRRDQPSGQIPRLLHQRRGAGLQRLGARASSAAPTPSCTRTCSSCCCASRATTCGPRCGRRARSTTTIRRTWCSPMTWAWSWAPRTTSR